MRKPFLFQNIWIVQSNYWTNSHLNFYLSEYPKSYIFLFLKFYEDGSSVENYQNYCQLSNFLNNNQQMQTAYQNQNMFRISFNKRKISHDKHSKGVSLAIQQPVLDQYNHIDLQKNTHNKRISHLMTQQACKSIKDDIGKGGESLDLNKWEKTLDRYMQAKQRIHQRNSTERNQFHFFKLSRINQYRKKKLAEENLVPMSLFKQAQINQVQQLKTIAESYNGIRQSIRLKNQLNSSAHVSKHNNDFSNQVYKRHSIDLSQNSHSSPETQQERILAKFVASYLKKKYKKIDKQKDEKDKSLNKFNFKNLLIMKTLNGHKNNN